MLQGWPTVCDVCVPMRITLVESGSSPSERIPLAVTEYNIGKDGDKRPSLSGARRSSHPGLAVRSRTRIDMQPRHHLLLPAYLHQS